ncbi:MAG: hypothetical protein IJM59_06415 [Proteobacteria bacterium]|nr:hypothetical protein [Pseudomonadota bacterium]
MNDCDPGKVKCDGTCIDPMTDNKYCGADAACQNFTACVDGQACAGGECSAKPVDGKCPEGQVKCGEACIDPQTNKSYCGADAACAHYSDCAADGKTCENGTCVGGAPANDCGPGKVKCGADCIDPLTDDKYCGADAACTHYSNCAKQGNACENGVCVGGTVNDCAPGKVKCGDNCVDPMTDNQYCGADSSCQKFTACVDDKTCAGGVCSAKPEDGKCPEGQVKCGESCIDPQTNDGYCGADAKCENYRSCEPDWSCKGGECQAPIDCGSQVFCQGSCYFPLESWKFCGADEFCSNYTSCKKGEICEDGKCKPTNCKDGQVMCYDAGCIDPLANNDYCGANEECQMYDVCGLGDETCQNGECLPSTGCEKGQINCDGKCIDPKTDNDYCGALRGCTGATACIGLATCVNGQCEMPHTCTPGVESRTCTVNEDGSVLETFCDGKGTELYQNLFKNDGDHKVWTCDEDNNAILTCDDENYIPYDGKCNPTVCKENETHCDGIKIMRCNEYRSGFEDFHECITDDPNATASCVDITDVDENGEEIASAQCIVECKEGFAYDYKSNRCSNKICEPGTTVCRPGNEIEIDICSFEGTRTAFYKACQPGQVCRDGLCGCANPNQINDPWVGCVDPQCDPGAFGCSEDGRTIEQCSENGARWEYYESCRGDQMCQDNTCVCAVEGFVECDGQCVEADKCLRCDEATKPDATCECIGAEWYCPDAPCNEATKPFTNCTCEKSVWDCPQFHCDEAYKPYPDCTCVSDRWDCPEFYCDADSKPFSDCKCKDGAWDCVQFHCNEALKPYTDCTCEYGEWICPKVHCEDAPKPFDECTCVSNEWDCPQFHCDEASRPYPDCECTVEEKWDCPEFHCDDALKPFDLCECKVGAWICPTDICFEAQPDEDCVCVDNNWNCPAPPSILLRVAEGNPVNIQEGEYVYLEVSLASAPKSDVTVTLSTQNTVISHELSEHTITFTPETWAQSVSFMLETQRDYRKTGDQKITVQAVSTSPQAKFNGLEATTNIDVRDIDYCKIGWTPWQDLQVTETGDMQEVEVYLTCKPDSNVTYSFISNNTSVGTVAEGEAMTFTPENWNVPQILKIRGLQDNQNDGGTTFIVIGVPDNANPEDFKTTPTLKVFKLDDDEAGINAVESIEITEGLEGTMRVTLATQPTANVNLTASVNAESGLTVTPSAHTFNYSNAFSFHTFTISSERDGVNTGDREAVITLKATSSDAHYDGMTKDVKVKIVEADNAGLVFVYDEAFEYGLQEGDDGQTACPKFHLLTKPAQNVTVAANSPSSIKSISCGAGVTFTPENWNVDQCIKINAKRDGMVPESDPVTHTIDYITTSTDGRYQGIQVSKTINIYNWDDYEVDGWGSNYNIVEGQTESFFIKLDARPALGSSTKIKIRSSDPSALKPQKDEIIVPSTGWNNTKEVKIDAINNNVTDPTGERLAYLKLEVESQDPNLNGITFNSSVFHIKDASKPAIIVQGEISGQSVSSGSTKAWIDCTNRKNLSSYRTDINEDRVYLKVSLASKPSTNVYVQVTPSIKYSTTTIDVLHRSKTLIFTPSNYNIPQIITETCEIEHLSNNYYTETLSFSVNNNTDYMAKDANFKFEVYSVGKEKWYLFISENIKQRIELPSGYYKISLYGAKGGGLIDENGGIVSGYAGNGGLVEAKIHLKKSSTSTWLYVGQAGDRGSKVSFGTDTNEVCNGGIGYKEGGCGDWGVRNFGYGGGGSTELHFGAEDCRSIVAGGGGGATRKSKELAGHGGNGGCTNANDSKCKGYYGTTYSNGATESSGNGANSALGKVQGGGGGGYYGGSAGSDKYVGGNGGTSKIDTSCYDFEYSDVKYTIGAYPNSGIFNDGYVKIETLKE